MNARKTTLSIVVLFLVLAAHFFGRAVQKASAISPPHSTLAALVKVAFASHRYQIAVPHRSVFQEARFSLIPVASACEVDCNGYAAQATCNPGCPQGACYCPNCSQSPGCTPYYCQPVTYNSLCTIGSNPNNDCGTLPRCELDSSTRHCVNPAAPSGAN